MDYLLRDSMFLGVKTAFDHRRLLLQSAVIDGQLCYHAKEVYTLQEMAHARYSLFKQAYLHRVGKAVEYMVRDALVEADAVWDRRISGAADDPRAYAQLTDCVLRQIEADRNPALGKAHALLRRLRRRELYKFVDEFVVPPELSAHLPRVVDSDVAACSDGAVAPEDVIVHDGLVHMGMHDENPIARTRFFRDPAAGSFTLDPAKLTHVLPAHFEERVIRLYCTRSNDPVVLAAAQRAFRAFLRRYVRELGSSPHAASQIYKSPARPLRLSQSTDGADGPPAIAGPLGAVVAGGDAARRLAFGRVRARAVWGAGEPGAGAAGAAGAGAREDGAGDAHPDDLPASHASLQRPPDSDSDDDGGGGGDVRKRGARSSRSHPASQRSAGGRPPLPSSAEGRGKAASAAPPHAAVNPWSLAAKRARKESPAAMADVDRER
jgi:hypothetical protein